MDAFACRCVALLTGGPAELGNAPGRAPHGTADLPNPVPAKGVDSDPPVCRAMLFYVVPCENWVAPLAAIVTAAAVGLALWWSIDRKQ